MSNDLVRAYEFDAPEFNLEDFMAAAKELNVYFWYNSFEKISKTVKCEAETTVELKHNGSARLETFGKPMEILMILDTLVPKPFYLLNDDQEYE